MTKQFVTIGSGEPFTGVLPAIVQLPVSVLSKDGDTLTTLVKEFKQGKPGWDEALYRWMFLNGYCYPEDNDREMRQSGHSV